MAKPGEKFKTYGNVFDNYTQRLLFRISAKGLFDELKSPIAIGKEANVFSATKDNHEVIVKIYRLEQCDFNRMYDYIKYDRRYIDLRRHKRKVIFAWVQREYRNLMIAREAGARVPTPLLRQDHILILECIGNCKAAPKLKDQIPRNPQAFFNDIVDQLKKLYTANLIHADLSAFNILNHNDQPVLIDFSQATTKENPRADEYLKRDIRNLVIFFKKYDVDCNEEEVYKAITI